MTCTCGCHLYRIKKSGPLRVIACRGCNVITIARTRAKGAK